MALFPMSRRPTILDSSDENTRRAVKELAPIVQEEVLGHAWVTIDVLSYYTGPSVAYLMSTSDAEEKTPEMWRPAFVISATDAEEEYWTDVIIPRIRQRFGQTPHDFDVWLWPVEEFSSFFRVDDVYSPNAHIEQRFYDMTRHMGTSCGLQGRDNRSGTWGGKVVLEKDGEEIELGLTNSHVLLKDILRGNEGPFPPGTFQNDHVVVSPSDQDHDRVISRMKDSITVLESDLKGIEERKLARGELDDRYQERQESYSRRKKHLEIKIKIAEVENREMGTIYAASGFTQATFQPSGDWPEAKNSPLDWALFEVHSDHRRQTWNNDMAKPLLEWGYVRPHTEYDITKVGRTSGKTQCRISGFTSILNPAQTGLPNIHPAADLGGKLLSPSSLRVFFREEGSWREALESGDSGSLILQDREGLPPRVLGLAFACHPRFGFSYMMPAELLVRNIEEVTGGKVLGFVDY